MAIDMVRGLAMVIMALDHTREFVHADAMRFAADDLTRTNAVLFFTRWVTHLCAPAFVLTAGMGARLRVASNGGRLGDVSRYLWTRGLWLIVVEVTVMRLAMNFTWDPQYPVLLIILWALGWSMVALAALIYLPARVVGAVGLTIVLLHNTLDGHRAASFGSLAWAWHLLHEPGVIRVSDVVAVAGYPVLPWIGVMAVGYWMGGVYAWEPARRLRLLRSVGTAMIVAFVGLRLLNAYGDPTPWETQPTALLTLLSFIDASKYPPSLSFLGMTLGPTCLLLAWAERSHRAETHPLVAFGRVPFAYYVVHFWVLHLVAAGLAFARYGTASFGFLFYPLPSMGGPRAMFPPDLGVSLGVTYVAWACVVVSLYPGCRWLAGLKAKRRDWWLGYV